MNDVDRRRTLEVLERDHWSPMVEYPSGLVERCHALRKVPIGELTAADLRLLIGQNIGLKWLVPLAIEVLQKAPWIEATFYPGDLMKYVKAVGEDYWKHHPEQHAEVLRLAESGV